MGLPIPAILTDKFCGCIELEMGLRVLSLLYCVFWIFYSVLELALGITYLNILKIFMPEMIEHYVAGGWCILCVVAYGLVVVALQINNRSMLLPAIGASVVNIIFVLIEVAWDVITIIGVFSAVGGLIYAVFAAYYTICLKAQYDKMGAAAPPPPMECQEQFDQV